MKTGTLFQLALSLFLVAGCSKGGNGGADKLRSQLVDKTFKTEGLDQVVTSISSACGVSEPVNGGVADPDTAAEADDGGSETTSASDNSNTAEADSGSESGDNNMDVAEDDEAGTDDDGTLSALIRATHESDSEIAFEANTLSMAEGTYEWKAVDGNTIEVTINGAGVRIDVQIDGSTLLVSIPPDYHFDCSAGEADAETTSANNSEPESIPSTDGPESEPSTAGTQEPPETQLDEGSGISQ
ncbi:MAG: hypothetical protein Q7T11_03715 [Deltaproteobacteria bacterium]|nr:hypothetical protein [Deltaproteobacteria bacterium]